MTSVEFEGVYAVVDMSKKKNRSCADVDEDDIADSSLPMNSVVDQSSVDEDKHEELHVDSLPIYSVVNKKKKKPEPINPASKKNATEASMMTMDNLYKTENVEQSPVKTNTMSGASKKIIAKPQFYCICSLVLAVVLAVTAVILITCFAILMSTITNLKSDIELLQQMQGEVCQNGTQQLKVCQNETQQLKVCQNETQQLEVCQNETQQLLAFIESQGMSPEKAVVSCISLFPFLPSGYYWVKASNGSAVQVYCDMARACGNVTGGWMRVAELNMTDSNQQCPSGFKQYSDPNIRTCVTVSNCSSVTFYIPNICYSKVCGKIIAYQKGSTNAFAQHLNNYVDGVSLTHGSPKQHIWTFVAALDETNDTNTESKCESINTGTSGPPEFVGDDYFCDTGSQQSYNYTLFYGANPLWDGAGCGPSSSCCTFNNPPWFYKQLTQPTTDDIEMRVCRDEKASNEDIAIEKIEIYAQ